MILPNEIEIIAAIHTGVHNTFNQKKITQKIQVAKECIITLYNTFKQELISPHLSEKLVVDLVEKAVNFLELSGKTNAGIGSVPQKDGKRRMDASIMKSQELEYGAVGSLREFATPISVARLIMERKDGHNMYAHDFAAKIAEEAGIKKIHEVEKEEKQPAPMEQSEYGTVGAVACIIRDDLSFLCAGTSTGGFGTCEPGRIGDSCIIGAGTYANKYLATSCTGHGESIVKLGVSLLANQYYKEESRSNASHPAQNALNRVLKEFTSLFPEKRNSLGIISIDYNGTLAVAIKGDAMVWAALGRSKKEEKFLFYLIYGSDTKSEPIIEKITH